MHSQTVLAALRDALADLYPEAADARVVVTDAGLVERQIAFSSRAQTNWHNILAEAICCARLDELLTVACVGYPDNQPLQQAVADYQRLLAEGGRLEAPILTPYGETYKYQ